MKLSIVVPCYNEEAALPVFLSAVTPIVQSTGLDYEIVFVDDGSRDATVATIVGLSCLYPQVRLVELSRNFGKEAAMTAGFTYATGDAIIPMDCDLQDPPELIPDMIEKWKAGFKVVHAVRRSRHTDTWLKRTTAGAFYRMMEDITDVAIPSNCGDYRLMDRAVVNAILSFPERNRFMKGIMAAAGFKAAQIEYDRPERAAGETKFNFWKLWNFALDGITGFSTVPLRVWTYIGAIVALFSFAYAGWIITKTMVWGVVTPGFATLTSVILFLGGIQLIGIGVLGEYIGRIVAETKRRPLFLVGALHGFEDRNVGPTVVPLETASAARGTL
ncbi:glycosyltransferase family 2 protein [Azospira sp. I09]|uniref:glycosyltransferase family 2 protein n=1 Tax=Azospira sp. I09 TaxID=1765049 RepID=UPI0012608B42|nr:glycosyltransferase family 2 protein [Azospira sp. I09]BBN90752.1 glycosyl transferase [Azospira sp. I09]